MFIELTVEEQYPPSEVKKLLNIERIKMVTPSNNGCFIYLENETSSVFVKESYDEICASLRSWGYL